MIRQITSRLLLPDSCPCCIGRICHMPPARSWSMEGDTGQDFAKQTSGPEKCSGPEVVLRSRVMISSWLPQAGTCACRTYYTPGASTILFNSRLGLATWKHGRAGGGGDRRHGARTLSGHPGEGQWTPRPAADGFRETSFQGPCGAC